MIAILKLENHGRTTYKASNVPDPARIQSAENIKAYAEVAAGDKIVEIIYPKQAITVRQPWAWAIMHAGKDLENRTRRLCAPGWYFLHAGKNPGISEYERVAYIIKRDAGVDVPSCIDAQAHKIPYGGVIAAMKFGEWVEQSPSRWFIGPKAVQIEAVVPLPFQPGRGAQGVFPWDHERAF